MNNADLASGATHYFRGELESFQTFKENLTLPSKAIPGGGETSFLMRYNDTDNPIYMKHEEGVPSKFWQRCYPPSDDPDKFQLIKSDTATFFSTREDCDDLRDLKFGYGDPKKTVWELSMGSVWNSKCKELYST